MIPTRVRRERPPEAGRHRRWQQDTTRPDDRERTPRDAAGAPIVAAVDGSAPGSDAADAAAHLAGELGAPLVFVYVRRGPSETLGEPYYQRRLNAEMASARRALACAKAAARREGVTAEGEILEGSPARRVLEFAEHRRARVVVLGSRRRLVGRSFSRRVIRGADRPVLVAGASIATAPASA